MQIFLKAVMVIYYLFADAEGHVFWLCHVLQLSFICYGNISEMLMTSDINSSLGVVCVRNRSASIS